MSDIQQPETVTEAKTPPTASDKGGCAALTGSARTVAVTERLVRKITEKAKASQMGLDEPHASLEIGQYAQHNYESLALMLVTAWHAKYDLVSIFAATMAVIDEEARADVKRAQNAELCDVRGARSQQ